jgi:hypothetical protein
VCVLVWNVLIIKYIYSVYLVKQCVLDDYLYKCALCVCCKVQNGTTTLFDVPRLNSRTHLPCTTNG